MLAFKDEGHRSRSAAECAHDRDRRRRRADPDRCRGSGPRHPPQEHEPGCRRRRWLKL